MVLFQMSTTRIITVYGAQGFICLFFVFLAYKILKRDRKRLNVIFSGFYISCIIGFIVNFIYAPLTDESVVRIMNFITNFGLFFAPIFIVVFDLILLKSEKVITTSKQVGILLIHGVAMFCMLFFALSEDWGVNFNPDTWAPIWSPGFFLYVIIVETVIALIPFLYFSFQVMSKFEDDILRKKWKLFVAGFLCLIVFMYGIFISNLLDNDTFRLGMGATGIILAIAGGYLIYYGVGKQLEK